MPSLCKRYHRFLVRCCVMCAFWCLFFYHLFIVFCSAFISDCALIGDRVPSSTYSHASHCALRMWRNSRRYNSRYYGNWAAPAQDEVGRIHKRTSTWNHISNTGTLFSDVSELFSKKILPSLLSCWSDHIQTISPRCSRINRPRLGKLC